MVQVMKQNVISRKISLLQGSLSTPLIHNNDLVCAEGIYLKYSEQVTTTLKEATTLLFNIYAGQGECIIKTLIEELSIPLMAGDLVLAHNVLSYSISNPTNQEFIASLCWPAAL